MPRLQLRRQQPKRRDHRQIDPILYRDKFRLCRIVHVRNGFVVRLEESFRLHRHANGDNERIRKAGIVFVQLDIVRDPQCRRVAERGVGSRQVQIARPASRKINISTRTQRHANEQVQPIASSWPWALIAVGVVLVGLLATNELFNTRLRPEGAT